MRFFKSQQESEKALEARLVKEIRKRGGMAVKLTSQFHRGLPDRLLLLPYHTMMFVEMKSTGKKPEPLQIAAMDQLRSMRFATRVVDSTEGLDELLSILDERLEEQREIDAEILAKQKMMKKALVRQQHIEAKEKKLKRKLDSQVMKIFDENSPNAL